jgi:hypothetical protein
MEFSPPTASITVPGSASYKSVFLTMEISAGLISCKFLVRLELVGAFIFSKPTEKSMFSIIVSALVFADISSVPLE